MKCTECGGPTRVEWVDSEKGHRRRVCRKCGHKFCTREVEAQPLPQGGDRRSEGRLTLWTPK